MSKFEKLMDAFEGLKKDSQALRSRMDSFEARKYAGMDTKGYIASSEKSPFGGFRAIVKNPRGFLSYASQQTWPTSQEAVEGARKYIVDRIRTGNYD